jgi:LuxR family maltose regulon positive regulatory protein
MDRSEDSHKNSSKNSALDEAFSGRARGAVGIKQSPPTLDIPLIKRPRLEKLLSAKGMRRLTLINAPAGYGKTAFLSKWALEKQQVGWAVQWLTLDKDDNDVQVFWRQVAALFSFSESEQCSLLEELALLTRERWQERDAISLLLSRIADIPEGIVLIFDSFEVITSRQIIAQLDCFIVNMPENVRLVIISRTQPEFQLSRFRAQGDVLEIKRKDLIFNYSEAAVFLRDVIGLKLEPDEVANLVRKTEGWVTGLRFFGLALWAAKDPARQLGHLDGNQREVRDYLSDMCLAGLSDERREFLLKTSVLHQMSPPLCDAVLERKGSWETLQELERSGLMIMSTGGQRKWYRYHPLFRDVLLEELEYTAYGIVGTLNHRAGLWFYGKGQYEDAVSYLIKGEDYERAAEALERCASEELKAGHPIKVAEWLARIPDEVKGRHVHLRILDAEAAILVGRLDAFEQVMTQLERVSAEGGFKSIPDRYGAEERFATLELMGHCVRGSVESWFASHDIQSLQASTVGSAVIGAAFTYLTLAYYANDMPEEALQALEVGEEYLLVHGIDYLYISALWIRIFLLRYQGRLSDVKVACQALMEYASTCKTARRDDGWLMAMLGLAQAHWEEDDTELAGRYLQEALSALSRVESMSSDQSRGMGAYVGLASYFLKEGSLPEAVHLNNKNKEDYRFYRQFVCGLYPEAVDLQVMLWLAEGNKGFAEQWAERQGSEKRIATRLARCRVLVASGWSETVSGMLDELEERCKAAGAQDYLIKTYLLDATGAASAGDTTRAMQKLANALSLAWQLGYVRTIADEGKPVAALLKAFLKRLERQRQNYDRDKMIDYVRRLILATERYREPGRGVAIPMRGRKEIVTYPLHKPLSAREYEILAMVGDGMSSSEIARGLHISHNTIKVHIRHIYRKLGVHSREEAVRCLFGSTTKGL